MIICDMCGRKKAKGLDVYHFQMRMVDRYADDAYLECGDVDLCEDCRDRLQVKVGFQLMDMAAKAEEKFKGEAKR